MTKENVPKLTPGSRYRVMSMMTRDEPLETEGTFKGYSMVGNIDALVIDITEKGKGKEKGKEKGKKAKKAKGGKVEEQLRLIPTQMVIFIEILDQVEEKKEEEETSTSRYYM